MAQLGMVFDATQVDPQGMSQSLPVSDSKGHLVVIVDSEMKGSKSDSKNGYLDLTVEIIDGEYKGASGHDRLNLYHTSEKTVEIAKRRLSAICHAVGVFNIADSTPLHGIPLRAVVGYQKLTPEQEAAKARGEEVTPFTEIKGYLYADGSPVTRKNGANAPAAPQQQAPAPPVQQQAPAAPAQQQAAPAWGAPPAQQQQETAPAPAQPWAQNPTAANPPWAAK